MPPETPAEEVRQLLSQVKGAKIPHQLRQELQGLLEQALHSIGVGGSSGHASLSVLVFREDWGLIQAPLAPLASAATATISGSQHVVPVPACNALEKFIALIKQDQRTHKPKIPSALAKAWTESARAIESQVGCGTLHHQHGKSAKHSPGHSSRRSHHR